MDLEQVAGGSTDRRQALAAWSGISEPADHRVGALVRMLGPVQALQWAAGPFCIPPLFRDEVLAEAERPERKAGSKQIGANQLEECHRSAGTSHFAAELEAPWRLVHERFRLRMEQLDVEQELRALEDLGGRLLVPGDDDWPAGMEVLGDGAPFALWVLGELPAPSQERVALVGARASTAYGNSVATNLAYELAREGCTVISGGAYGIDSAAHRGALRAPTPDAAEAAPINTQSGHVSGRNLSAYDPVGQLGGADRAGTKPTCPTVAVLCGGLANLYPAGNSQMFGQVVASGGALVSEMPPSFRPARWRFLERNRLIASFSQLVVVVEAGRRSGALATANRAAELGIEVGAVPGPVTSIASSGTNELLRAGAAVVSSSADVLELLRGVGSRPAQVAAETGGHDAALFARQPTGVRKGRPRLPTQGDEGDRGARRTRQMSRVDALERRVWDALPAAACASGKQTAAESGLSYREVQGALLGLQALGLVERLGEGQWRRTRV